MQTMFLINRLCVVFPLAFVLCLAGEVVSDENLSILEDGFLPLPTLVKKYGYPIETYKAVTDDGYQLTVHRIPYGKKCNGTMVRKPVLLQHGLLCSAFDYLIMGPQKALGYILADECYDVWLGNNRGNSLSRSHVNKTTSNPDFWDFSWHEMGQYDLPAIIDLVLNVTKQPKLHFIGHSQGSTQFFVMGSERPEYQNKIETAHTLSPVAYLKHLFSPFVKFMAIFHKITEALVNMVGLHEFSPQSDFLNFLGRQICKDEFPSLQSVCSNVIFLLCGFDEPQLNVTMLPAVLGHVPAGASTKQLIHFGQTINKGEFRQFDYGRRKNKKKYGTAKPPAYELKKINVPVALYYAQNDWLMDVKDVQRVKEELPNVISDYKVPFSKFNHLDFVFATDVKFLVYDKLLEVLERYR